MMPCPKCEASACVKDGTVKGRQRHLCHGCKYRHTLPHRGKSPVLKRQALELYLEGLGFRSIGRLRNCSHVTVYTWIKAYGVSIDTLRSATGVTVIEMDELHTYIGAKKTPAGSGWLWITMQDSSSTAYWVPAIRPRASHDGRPSRRDPPRRDERLLETV
jgi:transposase